MSELAKYKLLSISYFYRPMSIDFLQVYVSMCICRLCPLEHNSG